MSPGHPSASPRTHLLWKSHSGHPPTATSGLRALRVGGLGRVGWPAARPVLAGRAVVSPTWKGNPAAPCSLSGEHLPPKAQVASQCGRTPGLLERGAGRLLRDQPLPARAQPSPHVYWSCGLGRHSGIVLCARVCVTGQVAPKPPLGSSTPRI